VKLVIKLLRILLTGLSIVIFSSCGSSDKKDASVRPSAGLNRQMPMRVEAFVVRPTMISENIQVPGTLIANEATEIHPEISGRLVQLNVAEGKFISKGTLLAKIYDGDLQAQLKKLEVQLEIANTNEERSSQLLKIQGISKSDYDASVLNASNIKADIDITRANITKTEIRAPFSGRVGLKNISPGAYVTPLTILATIQQVDFLKLDFTVPEKYSSEINKGKSVSFATEGSAKTYNAKVMATESSITENTRTLMVRAIVENKDAALLPGSFARVMLNFDPDPNALMIPSEAVLPQARGKKVIIYRAGTAKFTDITTGIRDSARVQVVSGLTPGDTVIITGLLSIRPETKIQISKIVNP